MTITPETIAELRGLLAESPPLPYRNRERAYGNPSNGPDYVALEARHGGRWEEVATAHYEKWGGMGLALSSAAVNALPALLDAAERLAEVTAERDALAASVARVRAQVEEWEARVSFNEASLVHHPDNFWHGMATKGRECADEARRALDGSES